MLELPLNSLLHLLACLRWMAIVGQVVTVLIVGFGLQIPLPLTALFVVIGVYALIATAISVRISRMGPAREFEVYLHLGIDILQLTAMLYLSGGASNPFLSLFLVPIALTASTLPRWHVLVLALATAVITLLLLRFHLPLPMEARPEIAVGPWISIALWINFALALAMLCGFLLHTSVSAREHQVALGRLRERYARGESLLALAVQAADAAHELNTPLSVMKTLAREKHDATDSDEDREDFQLMMALLEQCRDTLKRLASTSAETTFQMTSLETLVQGLSKRLNLVLPQVDLRLTVPADVASRTVRLDPAIEHLLLGLMRNAAQASRTGEIPRIDVSFEVRPQALKIVVRDYGPGLGREERDLIGRIGFSSKSEGMGLGLALGHFAVERIGGSLVLRSNPDGPGTIAEVLLPWAAIEAED